MFERENFGMVDVGVKGQRAHIYIYVGPGAQSEDVKHFQRGLCQGEKKWNPIRATREENEEESLLGWARPRTEGIVCHQEQHSGPFQGRG